MKKKRKVLAAIEDKVTKQQTIDSDITDVEHFVEQCTLVVSELQYFLLSASSEGQELKPAHEAEGLLYRTGVLRGDTKRLLEKLEAIRDVLRAGKGAQN